MKAVEDQLDSLLCAYIGAYWWVLGRETKLGNGRLSAWLYCGALSAPCACASRRFALKQTALYQESFNFRTQEYTVK